MKKKNTLILDDEFVKYCELNQITNIDKLAKDTFDRGFSLLKYGETPNSAVRTIEIIKEVPVEKIVEKIIEITVPGDRIIEQVPVEVIKKVIDNDEINRLKKENENLNLELERIKTSLEKFNRASYMKNSDLSSLYDE